MIVEWEDAAIDADYDGPLDTTPGDGTMVLRDIGFLVTRNRRVIKLAGSSCAENQTVRWINSIPTRLVRRVIPLSEPTSSEE